MWGLARLQARLLVIAFCCAICGVVGAAGGAATPRSSHQRSSALRHENATLAQRVHRAILDLYALDSKINRVQAQLTSLGARREQIARERRSIRLRVDASRHNLRASQRQLSILVRTLYEQQTDDPLAVVLGAQSLDEAITTLDDLGRTAQQRDQIAARSREALSSLRAWARSLAREDERIRTLEGAASRTEASLAATAATRRGYVSTLSARRHLNSAQISRIDARARASAAKSAELTSQAITPTPADAQSRAPVTAPPTGGRTLTVVATGYSMTGTTATGVPVGWGTVAVDPSVIPLGSRMTIPGYGDGVAADTGSAVLGATVDLWFPTLQQAMAWGRRVVTVTLH